MLKNKVSSPPSPSVPKSASTTQPTATRAPQAPASPPPAPPPAGRPSIDERFGAPPPGGDSFGGGKGRASTSAGPQVPPQAHQLQTPAHQKTPLPSQAAPATPLPSTLPTAKPLESKQQAYANSCGAASLQCAALEMGVTHHPNGTALSNKTDQSEKLLYQSTSGSIRMTDDPHKGGYSMPDRMVATARALGLEGEVHMTPTMTSQLVKATRGDVVSNLKGSNVPIHEGPEKPLTEGQRRLRVVRVDPRVGPVPVPGPMSGLHYVMERPNGSVMDPASGKNYQNLQAANQDMAHTPLHEKTGTALTQRYVDTGISIVLSPGKK